MGSNIQAKLLRVIQEREVVKVGSSQMIEVDVRIIAATNKNLADEIQAGRFREDLFYRLNVVPIDLPPLRERKEDISALVQHFLKKFNEKRKKNVAGISDEAMRLLERYGWPGNVRELENAIERAVVIAEGSVIQPDDLLYPGLTSNVDSEHAPKGRLADIENEEIGKALERFNGHKGKAAEYLGINRKTLREKIRKHNIVSNP